MDIDLARTFLTILDTGNFGRAAERLNVTQSTVSTRIKTLEELLGRPMFIRSKAGVQVTQAGQQFKRSAETMVRAWYQAKQEVGLPDNFQTMITIGGQFTLWDRLLLKWIPWMRTSMPDVAIHAEVGLSDGLMRQLAEGLLDIGVMYTPSHRIGLVTEELMEEQLVLVSTDTVTAAPFTPDYVFVNWGPEFAISHSNAFPTLDTPPLYVSHGPLGLQYILENGGAGYFPMRLVRRHLAEGRLHIKEDAPRFRRPVYMVYAAGSTDARFKTALQGLRYVAAQESEE
ncbi:LysR family transcriptional regulator [Caenispirillum bisanense]|uniref:DNA-binding transcriptional regulator, LysR family n=1 Tax=Caenispirillum bisanense TaxID=414052 RepID=A0A286G6H2_9PROT|nr:LysR family transcriptional regulator [Caenispirillum bisanense]SOD91160.1 DNA-binding transcriptional regulator, LysR family [Caenispirillum bisanense]